MTRNLNARMGELEECMILNDDVEVKEYTVGTQHCLNDLSNERYVFHVNELIYHGISINRLNKDKTLNKAKVEMNQREKNM